jgi:hypothetical protein
MVLSPSAAWLDTVSRADAQLRFSVAITDGVTTWTATDGSVTGSTNPEAVISVDAVDVQLDPLTRKIQSGSIDVVVDDDWIRPILVNNRIKHQKCTVKIGAGDLAIGSFLAYFSGPIENIQPNGDGTVTLEVLDVYSILANTLITGYWVNDHPLEALEDILINKVGLTSTYVDTNSLDPANHTAIGHYVVSRGGQWSGYLYDDDPGVNQPGSAFELVNGLCQLLNGQLPVGEDGKLTFVRFDSTKAADGEWGDDEIIPGSFKQEGDEGLIVNRFAASYGRNQDGIYLGSYEINDTDSQSDYAYPGTTERILDYKMQSAWLGWRGVSLDAAINDSVTTFGIHGAMHGISGTRGSYPGPSPAEATISASRPLYLFIEDRVNNSGEIIKCTSVAFSSIHTSLPVVDPETGAASTHQYWSGATLSSVTRAQFGTSAVAHGTYDFIFDITPLVALGQDIINRFGDECPTIELETLLDQYQYQVGDFIAPTIPEFVGFGKDGLDGSDKYEIVGKRLSNDESETRLAWRLARAGLNTPDFTIGFFMALTILGSDDQNARDDRTLEAVVSSGLSVSQKSGLTGTVERGVVSLFDKAKDTKADSNHVFTASKDTWISVDSVNGELTFYPETLGNPQPSKLRSTETWIAKVVTDGSGITSITDLRTTTLVNGNRVHESTITSDELSGEVVRGALNLNSSLTMRKPV